jgi:hypothetical protein
MPADSDLKARSSSVPTTVRYTGQTWSYRTLVISLEHSYRALLQRSSLSYRNIPPFRKRGVTATVLHIRVTPYSLIRTDQCLAYKW